MTKSTSREVEHRITVNAPAEQIYQLIAEVADWPTIFPPTVHAEQLELSGNSERIRIWATANDTVKSWISRRTFDPVARRIAFRQEVSADPVASMTGTWLIEPVSEGESLVRLLHEYRAVGDDEEKLRWIDQAVDRNSTSELAALKHNVELVTANGTARVLSFADTVRVRGAAGDVYDFLNQADRWTERLPHVSRVELTEDTPGLQILEMDTTTKDRSVHTTKSIRVCFPPEKIVYKQVTLPALLSLHAGAWLIRAEPGQPDTVTVTSEHTVIVNEKNIQRVLGSGADVAAAQEFVRTALSGNSTTTLGHAKDYAEARAQGQRKVISS